MTSPANAPARWQPIATAPKDGTWLRLWRPKCLIGTWQQEVRARWVEEEQDFLWPDHHANCWPEEEYDWIEKGNYYEAKNTFTHWMPIPKDPK